MPDFRDNNPYQGNEENLSTSLSGFSDSLSKNADQLKRNSTNLKSNADSLDSNTKALLQMAKSFSEDAKKFTSDMKTVVTQTKSSIKDQSESQEDAISDMSKIFDKSSKNLDGAMTRGQKISSVFLTTLETVGSRIIKEFLGGASRIADSYKSSLNDITVRMQWTQQRYADMYNNASKQFLESGLGQQFSPKDYANALTETVVTGLRGDEAQRQAYHNLITNRLIPAISTNTVAYRRMAKQMGDTFNEGIVAIGKYTESVYGAEGLEEGKANNVIDALQVSLSYAASTGKYDEKDVQKSLDKMMFTVGALEDAGVNTDDFMSNIQAILEGNVDSVSDVFHAMGVGTKDKLLSRVMSDPMSLFEDYANVMGLGNSATSNGEIVSSLGGDTRTAMMIQTAINNGLDFDEISKNFSKYQTQAELDKWNSYLKKGEGRTNDQKLDTYEENVGTALGVIEAQVPRFNDLVSDVKKILGVLTTALLADTVKGGFGKGGGSFLKSSTFTGVGANGSAFANGGLKHGMTSFFSPKTRAINAQAGIGSSGLTAGTALAGGGLIAAGLIKGGITASEAYQNTEGTTAQKWGNAALGFISGDTSGAVNTQDKLDRVRENKGFAIDWKAVGKTAGTGALIGAGVGTLAGSAAGGIGAAPGAAIGAAIGGLTGAITSVTTQFIKYKDMQDYAQSALGKLGENIDTVGKTLSGINKSYSKYSTTLGGYNDLQKEVNEATGNEKTLLEGKLSLMEAEIEMMRASLPATEDFTTQIEAQASQMRSASDMSLLGGSLISAFNNKDAYTKIKSDKTKISEMSEKDIQKLFGIDASKMETIASQAIKAGYIKEGTSSLDAVRKMIIDYGSANYSDIIGTNVKGSDMDDLAVSGKTAYGALTNDELQSFIDKTNAASSSLMSTSSESLANFQSLAKLNDNVRMEDFRTALSGYLHAQVQLYKSQGDSRSPVDIIKEITKHDNVESFMVDFGVQSETAKKYKEFISSIENPVVEGWYKTGAYNIQKDNMLANLHKGEMVLTSANANMLRNLGSGGIGGLLSGLTALGQAKVTSVDEGPSEISSVGSMIVSAIQSQTESLLNSMSVIIGYVSKINGSKFQGSGEPNISKEMLTYEGT